ncbi:MAG: tyrosine-protein phosphatase [Sphingomonadales bacterium]|nr:tyrosine-protein phosphatase [Sphingomonadales bacterium]
MNNRFLVLSVAALALAGAPLRARVVDPRVVRDDAGHFELSWKDRAPVDVYRLTPGAPAASAPQLVARGIEDGAVSLAASPHVRGWFVLRDRRDGSRVTVAERVLPLEQGSNFRDLGGYPAWGGRHVRWGLIYRSGATPLLSAADLDQIGAVGLREMVDLRSSEERVLAPSRIAGVPYGAVGYPMQALASGGHFDVEALYRAFPELLKPQLRMIFADLLRGDVPIVYNCSAGQDRTGFASAMILAALGVPMADIYRDYELSTSYRHPEYEMPPIDPAQHPHDPVAQMFARASQGPVRKPQPLLTADGKPFLAYSFAAITARWGSPANYLREEIAVGPVQLAQLRRRYLQ